MSHPIINGLATYGVIRLYNKNHPILAFLVTLLFTIGPLGMILWFIIGWELLKIPLLIASMLIIPFAVGMTIGGLSQSNQAGWIVCVGLWFVELVIFILSHA